MDDFKNGKRAEPRMTALADLSGHLVRSVGRHPVRSLAVNVSRSGLGIVCFDELAPDSEIILLLRERGITLRVEWSKKDPVRKGVFQVGLSACDPGVNLVKLMNDDGILNQHPPASEPVPADNQEITFTDLRKAIINARTTDPGILHRGGLERLAQTYAAYPFNHLGKSYFVLLPKGLKPAAAAELDEAAAIASQIFIVGSSGAFGSLRLIWPKPKAAKA